VHKCFLKVGFSDAQFDVSETDSETQFSEDEVPSTVTTLSPLKNSLDVMKIWNPGRQETFPHMFCRWKMTTNLVVKQKKEELGTTNIKFIESAK